MPHPLRPLFAALLFATSASPLGAQVVTTLTVSSGTSVNASSLFGNAFASSPGTPTAWTGTITVQLDDAFQPTTLTILAATLVPPTGGSYVPLPDGGLGAAPGNYGFIYPGTPGVNIAIRDAQATASSLPLVLANNGANAYSFLPTGVNFQFSAGSIAYRVPGTATFGGTGLASGALADVATTTGSVTLNGSTLSLQLPLDFTRPNSGPDNASYRFFGTLSASGVIPEPSTWAFVATGLFAAASAWARRRSR